MRLHFCLILLLLQCRLLAQQPAYFQFAEDQFEGTDIYCVTQDKEGDYWFATDEGLFRHDGYAFFRIETDEMNTVSLFNFVRDSRGTIYCNNLNHQVFKIKDGKCSLIYVTEDNGNDISLVVTAEDELIVSTGRVAYLLDKSHALVDQIGYENAYLSIPYTLKEGVTIMQPAGYPELFVLKQGTHRFEKQAVEARFARAGLRFFQLKGKNYALDLENGDIFSFDLSNFRFNYLATLPNCSVKIALRLYELGDEIWMATSSGGVQRFRSEKDFYRPPPLIYKDELISHVYLDSEGNVLLSTFDHGLRVIPNLNSNDVLGELSGYNITRVEPGANGSLYFGTRSGEIISWQGDLKVLLSGGVKAIETLRNPTGSPYLFSDQQGYSVTHLPSNKTSVFAEGSLKNAIQSGEHTFVVALNRGVQEIEMDPRSGTSVRTEVIYVGRAYTIGLEKATQCLYISTREGILYKVGDGALQNLMLKGMSVNATCIQSLKEKTFISTRKKGILCLQKGKIVAQLQPRLAGEDLIITQFIYHEGRFYANSQKGFVVLDAKGHVLHILNRAYGLSANKVIDFCIQQGTLWIVHSRGVQRFPLGSIGAEKYQPGIRLREIQVNDRTISQGKQTHFFSSNERKFRFLLQSPTLRHRENTFYHFRLIGLDSKWHIQSYDKNEITYNALAPGDYQLEYKAENMGNFSPTHVFKFHISAPFYVRWWFISGCVVVFLSLVLFIYRRQLAIQQRKAQQINELNASRLTAIQSQMNPHFIFNSLNSIQDLVLKGDIDNSYTFITKFSNLVRRTLSYSDKDFIEFEQEIKLLELYLSLEKLRFKEELNYSIESEGIEDILIPPMLIQPFIENALVHGLLHKEGTKMLQVNFTLEGDLLHCEIKDNGIGRKRAREIKARQRSGHESFAVNAIRKRFEILKDHHAGRLGFEYIDSEEGTTVQLTLPVKRRF
jgi:ligand-binding sensor domain-containing protein